ncbi:hypothetical protein ACR30T_01845 [Neisseria gonorrhoeae]
MAAMQKEVQDRINRSALNLQPLEGLAKATKGSVRYFDPSYTLTETIYDQDGQIIAPAGTVVKPLEAAPIPFKMFFFDGGNLTKSNWPRNLQQNMANHSCLF